MEKRAVQYSSLPTPGTYAWPPDSMWNPCPEGHTKEQYRDAWGFKCCTRCGRQLVRS